MSTTPPRRVAVIQARTSSSRLPGKVLLPLLDRPMIVFMVERVRAARLVDHIVVATSDDSSDDRLAATLAEHRIACHRGSLDDVLDRFHGAARAAGATHVLRLTGDCPLMDADQVDRALAELATGAYDYVTNTQPPTFPDGLDVEGFTFDALERSWRNATLRSEREHVTPYMRAPASGFRLGSWRGCADGSALRWTVDHPDDYEHVLALVRAVDAKSPTGFDRFDLYRALEAGRVSNVFRHGRNEGYQLSLDNDAVAGAPGAGA